MNEQLLPTPEAARRLGVAKGTLEVWRSLKKGPKYIKLGRRVLYDPRDLDEYTAKNKILTRDSLQATRRDK